MHTMTHKLEMRMMMWRNYWVPNLAARAAIFSSITIEFVPAFNVTFFGCKEKAIAIKRHASLRPSNYLIVRPPRPVSHLRFILSDDPESLLPPLDRVRQLCLLHHRTGARSEPVRPLLQGVQVSRGYGLVQLGDCINSDRKWSRGQSE